MNNFGYYGKTTQRGDFVRFNLPQVFVNVLDDWLQSILIEAEQQYSEDWQAIYRSAFSYHFALSPNVAGTNGWIGHMAASEDKVGRRFPFCIAAAVPSTVTTIESLDTYSSLLNQMAGLFADLKSTALDLDDLQIELGKLNEQYLDSASTRHPNNTLPKLIDNNQAFQSRANSGIFTNNLPVMMKLFDDALSKTVAPYTLWCSMEHSGSPANQEPVSFISTGMPTPSSGISLFSNNWQDDADVHLPPDELRSDKNNVTTHNSPTGNTEDDVDSTLEHETDTQLREDIQRPYKINKTPDEAHESDEDKTLNYERKPSKDTEIMADVHEETSIDVATDRDSNQRIVENELMTRKGEWPNLESTEEVTELQQPEQTEQVLSPTVEPLVLDDDITLAPWDK